jgi:hypothetical protein
MTKGRLIELSQGVLVEEDIYNVVEKLRNYDPNLRVKFLNDATRSLVGDAPYAIFELCPDGIERLVFTVWELDDRVLERLYNADNARNNVLVDIDNNNLLVKKINDRRYQERNLEIKDIMKHAFSSPKGSYSFEVDGKKITLDDDPRRKSKVEKVEPK